LHKKNIKTLLYLCVDVLKIKLTEATYER